MAFAHLHVHSQYSLLDGLNTVQRIVEKTVALGMPAVALTDHGVMYGAVDFYNAAVAAKIKPIIGLEGYMAARGMTDRDVKLDRHSTHLLMLAEDMTGYHNLLTLASVAQLEGFYYYPRVDHDTLAAHSKGLIVTSGCMSAELPRKIQAGEFDEARKLISWYVDVFGRDNYYLELQHHDIPELLAQNRSIISFAKEFGLKLIATNDVHYVEKGDAELQDLLLAVQTGKTLQDPDRMRMHGNTYFMRSEEEMLKLFSEVPEAIQNTIEIADRCNVDLSRKRYLIPEFPVPEGFTPESYLRDLCEAGIKNRYGERCCSDEVRTRLEYELKIIHQMGFDSYFLIVWDICRHAAGNHIWYNARGSAAGSLVAYSLEITSVDPLAFGLYFERFLNPDRISMPDIDLDFQDDLRYRLLEYCVHKYGQDKVSQIITFGSMAARASIRDVGRAMAIPLPDVDRIAKMIPATPGNPVTIQEALTQIPDLEKAYKETPQVKHLLDIAGRLEGAYRNAGTHAAGLIICGDPIVRHAPLHRPTNDSADSPVKSVCQFDMQSVEALGLLKVDFLGLSTLTVMQRACDLIRERHGTSLSLKNIPVDDPETFSLLGKGHTVGVFQVEGSGMRAYLREMKPQTLSNIIAMIALYRPGPIGFIPDYIKRMHGEQEVEYRHPDLEPIFGETFGIPIYQEQIMRAAVDLAGYTMSASDDLRKAISKKDKTKIEKHRQKFITGAVGKGMSEEVATAIFKDWEDFARYGFNRAHAADYGVISVQTAYLKCHFPVEYMAALMSVFQGDSDKIAVYAADCRRMGLPVLPPDVNHSGMAFTIEKMPDGKDAIRFGMGAVKNVGAGPVDMILADRKDIPFSDVNDFAKRTDLKAIGRRALESLIKAGGLDCFGDRRELMIVVEQLIDRSRTKNKPGGAQQLMMFENEDLYEPIALSRQMKEVYRAQNLAWEKELLGLYVSDHPFSRYAGSLERRVTHYSTEITEDERNTKAIVAGTISAVKNHSTKTGASMAFVVLEDLEGTVQLVFFPKIWKQYCLVVEPGRNVIIEGMIDALGGKDPQILVNKVTELKPPSDSDTPQTPQNPPSPDVPPFDDDPNWLPALPMPDDFDDMGPSGYASPPQKSGPASGKGPLNTALRENVEAAVGTLVAERPTQTMAPVYSPESQSSSVTQIAAAAAVNADPVMVAIPVGDAVPSCGTAPAMCPVSVNAPASADLAVLEDRTNGNLDNREAKKKILVQLRSDLDAERGKRALKQIHGYLSSNPGNDKIFFSFMDGGARFLVQFPRLDIEISSDAVERVRRFSSVEKVVVALLDENLR